jgi:large subunit ribosomal protein L17
MKHRISGNQLHRRTNVAKGLYRSLLFGVVKNGRIETTLAKAKAIQGLLDRLVNFAKENSVNSRRQIVKIMGQDVKIPANYPERSSGYSRIIRLGKRFSDTAEMVVLEMLETKTVEPKMKEVKSVSSVAVSKKNEVQKPKKTTVKKVTKKTK